jgi:transcriptional regulator with XRE-family HTH domain
MESSGERFARNLRRRRERVGLTQEELADASNLHPTAIGKLERNERSPRLDTIVALSRALGLPTIYALVRGIG